MNKYFLFLVCWFGIWSLNRRIIWCFSFDCEPEKSANYYVTPFFAAYRTIYSTNKLLLIIFLILFLYTKVWTYCTIRLAAAGQHQQCWTELARWPTTHPQPNVSWTSTEQYFVVVLLPSVVEFSKLNYACAFMLWIITYDAKHILHQLKKQQLIFLFFIFPRSNAITECAAIFPRKNPNVIAMDMRSGCMCSSHTRTNSFSPACFEHFIEIFYFWALHAHIIVFCEILQKVN